MNSYQIEEIRSARTAELEALSSIASILAGADIFVVKVYRVLEVFLRISDADSASIRMDDPEKLGLRLLTSVGLDGTKRKAVLPYDSLAGQIFKQGQLVVVDDYASHESAVPNLVDRGVVSFLGIPIAIAGHPQAIITVQSEASEHFTPQRIQILRAIGDGLGVFLENARLYDQLTTELDQRQKTEERLVQRSEELEALLNFARILGRPGTFDEKAAQVLNELLNLSRSDGVTLRVPEDHNTNLRLVSEVGILSNHGRPTILPTQRTDGTLVGLSQEAYRALTPVVANDYPAEPYAQEFSVAQGVRSGIGLPIRVEDRCLGVVVVLSRESGHFTSAIVHHLTAIVDGLGALLENARLYREITLIEELGQRRDTFVSVASHELRTPMTTIMGFSELLLHRDPPPDTRRNGPG